MNGLLTCFPRRTLQLGILLVVGLTGNNSAAAPKNQKSHDSSSHRLENFLRSAEEKGDWTRLMLAIQKSVPAVEQLLNEGISPNLRGRETFEGLTPLIFAAGIGAIDTVELLIQHGARINDTDTESKTALLLAAENGHDEIVKLLLESTV